MKVAKINNKKNINDNKKMIKDEYSIKNFSIIIFIILLILIMFYLITTIVVKPNLNEEDKNIIQNQNNISLNHLLDMKEEYYVLVYDSDLYKSSGYKDTNYLNIYNEYIADYASLEKSLNIYSSDLADTFNKSYKGDKLIITNNLQDLKLNNEVLFKIKDNKIESYYVGSSEIIDKLSSLKKS